MRKKLYLNKEEKKVSGVCAGVADYFELDVTIVRVLWITAILCLGFGLIPYIILALVVPTKESIT